MTTSVSSLKRSVVAVLVLLAFVLQGTTSVLAGTTGAITGAVIDANSNKAISGARVSVTSPSQSATTTTDANGRFSFISLNPDTYAVTAAESTGYDPVTVSGVTVQADQTVTVSLQQPTKLKVIGAVTSRAASALVKPGTSADVYSINSVTQDKASAVGGGGNLNSAWSAITTVPGVFVAPNQAGYIGAAPSISIRGGDYNQIGYELDGVPVNRAFDNYPSGALSALGQQELQVYTGAPSANAEANGISGYINQVIRTGTAPASRNLTLAVGAPALYNKGAFEAGGANPARTFSYYLGAGTYSQAYRYYDQYNGASLQSVWGGPINLCPDATLIGCHGPQGQDYTNGGTSPAYALGAYQYGFLANVRDTDAIVNLHFGLPRKDGNRDDIQLLFDNNSINNISYTSTNDAGGAAFDTANGLGVPSYIDGYQFTGAPLGTVLPAGYRGGGVIPYLFPGSPGGRPRGAAIAPDRRDAFVNNQSVLKLQYQHNFGTSAFLRVYGYTYYSDWNQVGPQELWNNYLGFVPDDYELNSHTRGVSVQFSDQINSQHLISVNGSYTTAHTLRDNNTEQRNGLYGPNTFNFRTVAGLLVDSTNPYDGICYSTAGVAVNCYRSATNPYGTPGGTNFNPAAAHFTLQQAYNGTVVPAAGICGGGPCAYMLAGNGLYATYNTVRPKFSSFAVTDQWKPTNRLNVDLGLRMDRFEFDGSDTTNSAARTFFFNAYNRQFGTNLQNVPNQVEAYNELQPRVGMTYTVNPATVLRLSYGRYAEAPNSAFEQYDYLQPNSPPSLAGFLPFGVGNTPGHAIRPQVANNYDFSYEHQFNRDTSMKLTPFYRKTQDQIQQFYLDQKTSFVSGLNVGRQTSQGVELEVDKGDFSRNGLAARLSFTYTNSYINYTRLATGQSIIDGFNTGIKAYNAYTSFCAANPGDARCGSTGSSNVSRFNGGPAIAPAPCYTAAGAPDPACAAGSVANPYWNAPVQALLDPTGKYPTFDIFPGGIGAGGYSTYGAPFVSTLIVQYKHGPLAITPALQFSGGSRYGVPLSTPGIYPDYCTAVLPGSPAGDPRYKYGAPGGSPYDSTACHDPAGVAILNQGAGAFPAYLAIPNPYTRSFDSPGAFVAPNSLLLHTQVTYDVNKRVTLVGNFANIVNRCWGGTHVATAVNHACNYVATYGTGSGPAPLGNAFNPGWNVQPLLATPYAPTFPSYPFNMYFEARIKL
jgi:Carboxypeptidase regulatory-like domain/TonB dependent receptor/TonB-dependent Receptor Plug Domain